MYKPKCQLITVGLRCLDQAGFNWGDRSDSNDELIYLIGRFCLVKEVFNGGSEEIHACLMSEFVT